MIRVLIADDHAIIREGLKKILLAEYPSCFIDEASDTDELIKKANTGDWSFIISDMTMPGRSGMDALVEIKKDFPKIPMLMLSMHAEERYAMRALKAGASGYLTKDSALGELITAVKSILQGRRYISAALAESLAGHLTHDNPGTPHENLSARELDVYRLLTEGNSILKIAEKLSLNKTTVSTYRARILTKMNMTTNAELIRYALDNNLW